MAGDCSVQGCAKPTLAKGYCQRHYTQWRKHGDPLARVMAPAGEPDAWVRRVVSAETDDCLIWPFSTAKGYPQVWFEGEKWPGNRLVCHLAHGAPPASDQRIEAAHSCGVRACMNKRHIRWATCAENAADKVVHGTARTGENSPVAKLTEASVREILELLARGIKQVEIAGKFSVSRENISRIAVGKGWPHVARPQGGRAA